MEDDDLSTEEQAEQEGVSLTPHEAEWAAWRGQSEEQAVADKRIARRGAE